MNQLKIDVNIRNLLLHDLSSEAHFLSMYVVAFPGKVIAHPDQDAYVKLMCAVVNLFPIYILYN